jgi:O-antigen ligase
MSAIVEEMNAPRDHALSLVRPVAVGSQDDATLRPNFLVRSAFVLSVFSIPFSLVYLPGTGDRFGVMRIIQLLTLGAILSQPRVCLRLLPTALIWLLGYIVLRTMWGLWFTPEMAALWSAKARQFITFLPWAWFMFNVLQFPGAGRAGLWALGLGGSLCALLHIAGIGVQVVDDQMANRSAVFGLNANDLGLTYATAATALLGMWVCEARTTLQRLLPFPLIALIGFALAKTGSRSAVLVLAVGVSVLMLFTRAVDSKARRVTSLALLGAMVAVALWQIPTVLERFEIINVGNLGENNPRARMLPVLWEMFLRHPIFGMGPESYSFELTRKAMPYLLARDETIVAHNLVLLVLVEMGIIGLLVFSIGPLKALAAAWRARLTLAGPLPLALFLPLVLAAATVSQPMFLPIFWFAVAYALAGSDPAGFASRSDSEN